MREDVGAGVGGDGRGQVRWPRIDDGDARVMMIAADATFILCSVAVMTAKGVSSDEVPEVVVAQMIGSVAAVARAGPHPRNPQRSVMRGGDRDGLGGVHRRAAADGDDDVGASLAHKLRALMTSDRWDWA